MGEEPRPAHTSREDYPRRPGQERDRNQGKTALRLDTPQDRTHPGTGTQTLEKDWTEREGLHHYPLILPQPLGPILPV